MFILLIVIIILVLIVIFRKKILELLKNKKFVITLLAVIVIIVIVNFGIKTYENYKFYKEHEVSKEQCTMVEEYINNQHSLKLSIKKSEFIDSSYKNKSIVFIMMDTKPIDYSYTFKLKDENGKKYVARLVDKLLSKETLKYIELQEEKW